MSVLKLREALSKLNQAHEEFVGAVIACVEAKAPYADVDAKIKAAEDALPDDMKGKKAKKGKAVEVEDTSATDRKVFTATHPPETAGEQKTFQVQWKKLVADKRNEQYLEGMIDSAGTPLEIEGNGELVMSDDFSIDEPAEDEADVTFTEVNQAAHELAKAKGKDAVFKIMSKFNLKALSGAPADKYKEILSAIQRAMV